jgi:hypothetical protein
MLDLFDVAGLFEMRVLQKVAVDEAPVDRDVDVFVDRRGNEKTAVIVIVRRKVRPAAAQRDA